MAINAKKRLKVFERDSYKCVLCKSTEQLTVDHITPKSQGGLDGLNNLRTLCFKCNTQRGNYNPTWKEKWFNWLFTKKDAHDLKNSILWTAASKDGIIKQEIEQKFEQRFAEISPKVQSFLDKHKQTIDIEIVGNKNSISSLTNRIDERFQKSQGRDEMLLRDIYEVADRIDALERYLQIEYVKEEVKEYRKIIN